MAAETTEGGIEGLPSRIQCYPRDLLRRFSGTSCLDEMPRAAKAEPEEEIELSLGLSLGGCFTVQPRENRLFRSSSIASLSMLPAEHDLVPPLNRTCSLPVDTEEENRKRKEIQSLKRLEAKRKRSEKRMSKPVGGKEPKEENMDEDTNGWQGKADPSSFPGFPTSSLLLGGSTNGVVPPELPVWAMGAGRVAAPLVEGSKCFGPISHGSVASQGSSSSSLSDFESRPLLQGFDISGLSSCTEGRSPSVNHADQKAAAPAATLSAAAGKKLAKSSSGAGDCPCPSSKKTEAATGRANGTRDVERSIMEEMPCVTTRGDGPNGRRIEGFLYKYRKGEEVRIVCVCHGSFLTPAEFVKHAGGGDVDHPLRHIVVSPSPSALYL